MLAAEVAGQNLKLLAVFEPRQKFDTSTRDFNRRSQPSASELMASIKRKNRTALLRKNNFHLAEMAFRTAQHESGARNQITRQIDDFWRKTAYGKAPGVKPDNCILRRYGKF
jgi:hypothetical protein